MDHIRTINPSQEAAKLLSSVLEMQQQHPVLLLLSGGSALSLLDHVDGLQSSPNLTITVLDERFSEDPHINNFAQVKTTAFCAAALGNGAAAISTAVVPGETLTEAGQRFEDSLRAWKQSHPTGVVIATMGIGTDGHVAGLFPRPLGVDFSGPAWVCAYVVPPEVSQYTKRFSTTYTFLRTCVDEAVVYALGEDKRAIVEMIKRADCRLEETPACIIKELKRVTVVTD